MKYTLKIRKALDFKISIVILIWGCSNIVKTKVIFRKAVSHITQKAPTMLK